MLAYREGVVMMNHRNKVWCLVLGLCLLGGAFGSEVSAMTTKPLDLKSMTWLTVNDTVMGGRSSATITWSNKGGLVWSGQLSLQNNGGFVSIRTQGTAFDWSAYDGIEVVLVGAGRDVQVTTQRRDMVVRAGGYRALVPTQKTGDTRVFIPFSAFVLKRFGREIRGPALSAGLKKIGRLGLLISDKREGTFRVTLKSVKPVKHNATTRIAPGVRDALIAAIKRGVPVFNAGDAKGCATIYRDVLKTLVKRGQLGSGTWAKRLTAAAIDRSLLQSPTPAAWTLRRAMDALLHRLAPR